VKEFYALLFVRNDFDRVIGDEVFLDGTACPLVAGGYENVVHFVLSARLILRGALRGSPRNLTQCL
jgi:hypothetical protein